MEASVPATAADGQVASTVDASPLSDVVIVKAARQIIAESGVQGLTMRRLSAKLGVALGATYHHVPTKDALMKLVATDLYRDVEVPEADEGDWATLVKAIIMSTARMVSEYPGMAAYMMAQVDEMFPLELNQATVNLLRGAGFSQRSVSVVMGALYFYSTGLSANAEPVRDAKTFEDADVPGIFEQGLDLLLAGARVRLADDIARREARRAG